MGTILWGLLWLLVLPLFLLFAVTRGPRCLDGWLTECERQAASVAGVVMVRHQYLICTTYRSQYETRV